MLNAGIRPYDSLASMIKISPPWLKQRLKLPATAWVWPEPGCCPSQRRPRFPRPTGHPVPVHPRQPGRLLRSAGQVQPPLAGDSLKQIELAAGLVKNFALIFIGALMILVLLGAYQAQQLIQSMNH
ncbi:hypothetical protein [Pseudomonas aeruginosa]|uniref:hypothetical protein n=1 Tax=Pseudomonas aeruginosa TaxID=287 RepID=UPI000AF58570|nr:hypothetical protein [Pseudomonas aeruginosa]